MLKLKFAAIYFKQYFTLIQLNNFRSWIFEKRKNYFAFRFQVKKKIKNHNINIYNNINIENRLLVKKEEEKDI